MIRSIFNFTLVILVLFAMTCEKDDATPQVDENGLTTDITDLVPEEILDEIIALGMPINGGINPPILDATYVGSPFILLDSNRPGDFVGQAFSDYTVTFSGQKNNDLTIMVDYLNGSESGSGIGSFIVGDGCKFSVFVEINSIHTGGTTAKLTHIISGKLVGNGIEDMHFANFMIDNNGNPQGIWIENGEGRIIHDQDGFSPQLGHNVQWYSKLPDCPCEYSENLDGQEEMCGKWYDCGTASESFHYGATHEIRWYTDQPDQPGQQCTYDANKKLITAGIAAGSPDRVSPRTCIFLTSSSCMHYIEDVLPWGNTSLTFACGGDNTDIIPCWQYLQNWPANKGNGCAGNNPVTDIQHMLKLIGSMSCEDATLLIKSAHEDDDDDIDTNLRKYLLGETSGLTDGQLIAYLQSWKAAEQADFTTDDDLIVLIDLAISNLQ